MPEWIVLICSGTALTVHILHHCIYAPLPQSVHPQFVTIVVGFGDIHACVLLDGNERIATANVET